MSTPVISPAIIGESEPIVDSTVQRKPSRASTESNLEKRDLAGTTAVPVITADDQLVRDEKLFQFVTYDKLRPFILTALALLILGWWVSATILKATRHRWYVASCLTLFGSSVLTRVIFLLH